MFDFVPSSCLVLAGLSCIVVCLHVKGTILLKINSLPDRSKKWTLKLKLRILFQRASKIEHRNYKTSFVSDNLLDQPMLDEYHYMTPAGVSDPDAPQGPPCCWSRAVWTRATRDRSANPLGEELLEVGEGGGCGGYSFWIGYNLKCTF